jgi:hypothetical protein
MNESGCYSNGKTGEIEDGEGKESNFVYVFSFRSLNLLCHSNTTVLTWNSEKLSGHQPEDGF